jgi:hypothetical protein
MLTILPRLCHRAAVFYQLTAILLLVVDVYLTGAVHIERL